MSDVESRVKALIHELSGRVPPEVTLATRFEEDLGMDSLDVVELVIEIEDEFGIHVPDRIAADIETVGDLVAALTRKAA